MNIEKVTEHAEAGEHRGHGRTELKTFACAHGVVLEENMKHEHACSQSTEGRCGIQ
jgi:hypothetical protein